MVRGVCSRGVQEPCWGAAAVDHPVTKSDGGYGYDVTDLAAIRYRIRDLKGARLLYVVGLPQKTHLQMVFQTARNAGWVSPTVDVEHVGHGSILVSDGKILRSRAGESVKLIRSA